MTTSLRFPSTVLASALAGVLVLTGCTVDTDRTAPDRGTPTSSTDRATAAPTTPDPITTEPALEQPTPDPEPTSGPTDQPRVADPGSALAALRDLPIKGRAPRTGYDRDLFGSGWLDPDRNGCDTRNDMLAAQLANVTTKPGTNGCVVLSGVLSDPYSGRTIHFTRGQSTSTAVQIDHVVALSDAWQKGAQQWDTHRRELFANDPMNLLAVDGPLNQQKGDGDAATWLPPNKSYRCAYVARQVAVKAKWGLWVTQAEHDAIERVLTTCPDEPLPTGGSVVPPADNEPTPAPPPAPQAPTAPAPSAEVTEPFKNCTEARAAGAAPVLRGDPGYGQHLDRDGDGVGCE